MSQNVAFQVIDRKPEVAPIRKTPARPVRCARDISTYDALAFRLKEDGRQFKKLCGERRALAVQIALSADPDGTHITVGPKGLRKVGSYSESKVKRLLKDLTLIGCLCKERYIDERGIERERLSEYGTKVRYFDFAVLDEAQSILESTGDFEGHPVHVKECHLREGVSSSNCEGVSDSREGSSRIHEPRPSTNRTATPVPESDVLPVGDLFHERQAELRRQKRDLKEQLKAINAQLAKPSAWTRPRRSPRTNGKPKT